MWVDDFDGTELNLTNWNHRIGAFDPQYHRAENVTVSGGILTITANKEEYGGLHYTSGLIYSTASWLYGRFEAYIRVPGTGAGLQPAFWLLPTTTIEGGWEGVDDTRKHGEIDIMEHWTNDPNQIKSSLIYGDPGTAISVSYDLPAGDFGDAYHLFAVEWDSCVFRFYVDSTLYRTALSWFSSVAPFPYPFNARPFNIILNLGFYPGTPPDGTFPAQMLVDYVKVYKR